MRGGFAPRKLDPNRGRQPEHGPHRLRAHARAHGAQVSVAHAGAAGKEPYGIIEACYTPDLRGCEVPADKIAGIIDEVPVLRWWRRTRMESPCSVKWGSFV